MLREYKQVKQEPGKGRRRWWTGDGLELIAWFDEADCFTGYQLCYRGCAFTWRTNGFWTHVTVGSGIGDANDRWGGYSVPVLQANGAPPRPPRSLIADFERSASTVSETIRETVVETLQSIAR